MPKQKPHTQFVAALRELADPSVAADVSRFFRADPNARSGDNKILGVSIMDFQARAKHTSGEHRKALFNLYIRRHDRINNWTLVDRAAPYVEGRWASGGC